MVDYVQSTAEIELVAIANTEMITKQKWKKEQNMVEGFS